MKSKYEVFVDTLEKSLATRVRFCEDHAMTPSGILQAVLVAVSDAKRMADLWEETH